MFRLCGLITVLLLNIACNQVFVSQRYEWGLASKRKLAILPLKVSTQQVKIPLGSTIDMLKEQEKTEGYILQRDLYRYFLREMAARDFKVSFIQDVNTTNEQLMTNGIQLDQEDTLSIRKISEALGVDAIMVGIVDQRVMSGTSFWVEILNGVYKHYMKVHATFTLYDMEDGNIMWQYEGKKSKGNAESMYALSKHLLRDVPTKFPY